LAASLPEMLASRATRLNSDQDFRLSAMRGLRHRLLVLGPEPSSNRFPDVGERFLFVFPLRNAPRQGWAFHNNPAVFSFANRDVKDHTHILPIAAACYKLPARPPRPRDKKLTKGELSALKKLCPILCPFSVGNHRKWATRTESGKREKRAEDSTRQETIALRLIPGRSLNLRVPGSIPGRLTTLPEDPKLRYAFVTYGARGGIHGCWVQAEAVLISGTGDGK